jgi:uncharacterized caspase-like protein
VATNKGSSRQAEIEAQVQLQPGTNTLSVIAANEKATSKPEERKIIFSGKSSNTAKPSLILLSIGVSKYQRAASNLDFAHKDAEEIAAKFKAQQGVLFNRVETRVIPNEMATRAEIIRGLGWMKSQAKQGDYLALFLSGHGSLDGRGDYYFHAHEHDPNEEPEIYDVKWSTLLDGLTAVRGANAILFVDSCRAGAASGNAKRKGDEGLTQALKDLKIKYQGVVFFAASSDDEPSVELRQFGFGAFTWAMLEGLKGGADSIKKDGVIYVDELGTWIRQRVKELTDGKQHAIYDEPPGFRPFPIFALSQSQ